MLTHACMYNTDNLDLTYVSRGMLEDNIENFTCY